MLESKAMKNCLNTVRSAAEWGHVQALLIVVLATAAFFPAGAAHAEDIEDGANKGYYSVLLGYGATHPGLGNTREHVETADLVLRYGRFLTPELGRSWYRSRHELLVEAPLHLVVDPEVSPMVGVNFLACWSFTARESLIPYFFAGGGLLYTDADIPGMGSNLNGNYQFGGGMRFRRSEKGFFMLEYRFHHISNADTAEPNYPLNSSKVLLGYAWLL